MTSIWFAGDNLFWLQGGDNEFFQQAVTGGARSQIATGVTQVWVNGDNLFWLQGGDNKLFERAQNTLETMLGAGVPELPFENPQGTLPLPREASAKKGA